MKTDIIKRGLTWLRRKVFGPKRYYHLFKEIVKGRCRKILEVGTWNGRRAFKMIETAKQHNSAERISYYGFDLFEEMTSEINKRELSKKPPSKAEVELLLKKTGANIYLYGGFTSKTMPVILSTLPKMDFIFIDGGHSIDTISNDWFYCKQLMHEKTVVIFDDYYFDRDDYGCKKVVEGVSKDEYRVEILPPRDRFKKPWGILYINFVKVTKR